MFLISEYATIEQQQQANGEMESRSLDTLQSLQYQMTHTLMQNTINNLQQDAHRFADNANSTNNDQLVKVKEEIDDQNSSEWSINLLYFKYNIGL